MESMNIIAVVGMVISIFSAIFAYFQAQAAKKALKQSYLLKLFSTFETANQQCLLNPELLYSVHGVDRNLVSEQEARNIIYLSSLIDAFQHFYGEDYRNNYIKMAEDMKVKSTFLNKILSVDDNKPRWQVLRKIYYGSFDEQFIHAIDHLITYEEKKRTSNTMHRV